MTDAALRAPIDAAAIARAYDRGELLLRRWGATWIDFILFAVMIFAPLVFTEVRGLEVLAPSGFAGVLVYYPLTEGLWGRTLGMLVTGTIIVDADGRRANFGKVMIRTLFRLIEVNPFFLGGIPAGVALLSTECKQRIGDLAAQTYVLPVKALTAAAAVAPPAPGPGYTPVIVD
jgi:uncharacterized RDD family membrane protein YckC